MALQPKETLFFFNEPHSNFRGILAVRGLSKNKLIYENLPKLSHDTNIQKFTIIDASSAYRFDRDKELIGSQFILFFCCTKENLQHAIDFFKPQTALAFKDEEACLEYLYATICQSIYGAIIDFDETEALEILKAYKKGQNEELHIINCCDAEQSNDIPPDVNFFFSNIVNSIEIAHKILTATTIFKTMSRHADKCVTSLIVTNHSKSYQKVFWGE